MNRWVEYFMEVYNRRETVDDVADEKIPSVKLNIEEKQVTKAETN